MIRIGIYGYGNLAIGVEKAVLKRNDFEVVCVFTRRDPSTVKSVCGNKVVSVNDVLDYKDKIDVLILCGGSAKDLPVQSPELVKNFNIIDSFDTHKTIIDHFNNVNKNALETNHVGMISIGWDPGLFSLERTLFESIIPDGKTYTFWGKGVSQGHSDAIRRIPHVLDARQYTIPVSETQEDVRNGNLKTFTARQMHKRDCYVVVDDPKNEAEVEKAIKEMPNYFSDYDTTVHFISQKELNEKHATLPHGGLVIRNGNTSQGTNHVMEFKLTLDSNPEFTASVMLAYAKVIYKMYNRGEFGAKTILDVKLSDLSDHTYEELLTKLI